MTRKMKDSGIEWVGEIPENWEVIKLGKLGRFSASGIDKKIEEGESLIKIVNYTDVYGNQTLTLKNNIYMEVSAPENKIKEHLLEEGDVVFTPSSETIEDIGVSALVVEPLENTSYSYHVLRYRINSREIVKNYRKYLCNNHYVLSYFSSLATGSIRKTLSRDDFKNTQVLIPGYSEQIKIGALLDTQWNKIDSLTAIQKEAIKKFTEYKQSLITEAVTKGLDPTVPMKDSGIEWIGEIPEHWFVKKMKYLGELSSNGVDKKIYEGEELYKAIHFMDVSRGYQKEIGESDEYLTISASESKASNTVLKAGDVLLTNSSETADDMGISTVIKEDLPNILFGYHLMRFRPYERTFCLEFEKYLFSSQYLRKWFEYNSVGMTRYGLGRSGFSEARIMYPPIDEQREIASFLDKQCNIIDMAIFEKKNLTIKLEEYKKSIIYEYVTGKKEVQ